ncbi:mediator of RNA polymerase II transcription subunit 15a-like isoform X2 [Vitis riparia]|uniref:mediator of RNA polymerase II transcription subunit 15a-like isoform X2 n=1 Tax=Vitis riparia TaxID=96939 RepID=UPI00155AE05F|nr:mediator of RNA polymerase II transcription subunit 15a-like isoform X2 [Vitis riparia]
MDTNNWRPAQAEPAMDLGDWRTQLPPDSRQRIVNKIMDTLKRHLPVSGQEGLHELRTLAVRLEENAYTAAMSQSDYLRKISLKMLAMETESQTAMPSNLPSNFASNSENPPDPGQGNALTSLQHVAVGALQQNPVSAPQQANNNNLSSQNGVNVLQQNINQFQRLNLEMDTLKRDLPVSGQEGLHELRTMAVRFEENTYTAATSQSDYLRKISLEMPAMVKTAMPSNLPSNFASNSENPPDPASHSMQPQVHNQGQQLPVPLAPNQSQTRQQLLAQNIQTNIASGVPSSASLPSTLSSVTSLNQTPMQNVVGQNSGMQNISGIPQNSVGNSMGQGVPSNMFANSQRQSQGRPQVVPQQQQQQSQSSQQYIYQQQLQHQLLKQKYQQGNIQLPLMQSHIQQQQQSQSSQQ